MKKLHMKKSRGGMALIMALVIILAGSSIVAVTFDIVFRYAWLAQEEKTGYVDHTTLLSYVQLMKGLIISENVTAGKTQHALALKYDDPGVAPSNLTMDDLRFEVPNFPSWQIRDNNVKSGVGTQRVEVDVYDMFYDLDWIDPSELEKKGFPPIFKMKGADGGSGSGNGSGMGSVSGGIEGGATSNTGGTHGSSGGGGAFSPSNYGAYLIRASLFSNGRANPSRVIDAAFVQILTP